MKKNNRPYLITNLLLVFLTGCSTTQHVTNNTIAKIDVESSISTKKVEYPCQYNINQAKKGGNFYKSDGPLEIPIDLSNISEPTPIFEPLHKWANKPYNRLGQDFYPIQEIGDYKKRGVGTWYGRRYHGEKTSSGETYDMFKMTAASPILPIPSYAKVTNLKNGRSVTVRINDRGPFLKNRIIDLSFVAACFLDYATQGSTEVLVESLKPNN